jgi:hypothetical protein
MGRRRVDLQTAAEVLGISSDAVRKRAKRGTIPYETGADGKLYVWVDIGETEDYPTGGEHHDHGERGELVEELRSQLEYLRGIVETRDRELSEMRRLLAGALERIPELEAPRDERDAPETVSEGESGAEAPVSDTGEPRRSSWWRRFFGFE